MTQMIHAPTAPSWPPRVATTALAIALTVRVLPGRWRMWGTWQAHEAAGSRRCPAPVRGTVR